MYFLFYLKDERRKTKKNCGPPRPHTDRHERYYRVLGSAILSLFGQFTCCYVFWSPPCGFFFLFRFFFFLTVDGYFSISQMHMMMHVCCWLAETGRIGENGLWKTNHLPRSRLLHMITSILGMCWLAHWWWWRYIHFETSAFPVSTADKCKCILADEING